MAYVGTASWADAGSSSDEDNVSDVEDTPEVEVEQSAPAQRQHREHREHREPREHREHREHREPREHRERAPVEIPTRGPFVAFVGNLAYGVDEDILGNFFVSLGCSVNKVNIHRDRETGKSKGFSHVEFGDRDSLVKALEMREELKGRALKVDLAAHEPQRGGRSRGGPGGPSGGRGRGRDSREPRESGDARRGGYEARSQQRPPRENREFVQHDRRAPPSAAPVEASDEPPKERTKIVLQPRSAPLETVGQPAVFKPSIFGEGKPRVEGVDAAPAPVEEPAKRAALIIESPRSEPATKAAMKERPERKNKPKPARDAHREVQINGKDNKTKDNRDKKGPARRKNPDANAAAAATAAAVKANKKRDDQEVGKDDFVTAATKKTGVAKKDAAVKPVASAVSKTSNPFSGLDSDDDSEA